jgi:hypothetical protein
MTIYLDIHALLLPVDNGGSFFCCFSGRRFSWKLKLNQKLQLGVVLTKTVNAKFESQANNCRTTRQSNMTFLYHGQSFVASLWMCSEFGNSNSTRICDWGWKQRL